MAAAHAESRPALHTDDDELAPRAAGGVAGAMCPVCTSAATSQPFLRRWPWYHRCRGCGIGLAHPQPTDAELADIYGADYFDTFGFRNGTAASFRRGRQAWHDQVLARAETHFPVGRLVDLGSGLGDLLAAARRRGWHVTGIEGNPYAVQAAEHAAPGATLHGSIEDRLPTLDVFDLIVCTDVLEHLRSPRDGLAEAFEHLKPGGGLVVTTINVESLYARLAGARWVHIHRDHLWYFNCRALRTLAQRAGFEVVSCGPARKTFHMQYVLEIFAHIRNAPALSAFCHAALRLLPNPLLNVRFTVNEGLLLIARRPRAAHG